jgi:hypothetical protein
MEEESAGLPLFPIIVALLVVLVAAAFYIVQLRADNDVLRAELALARQQAAAAPVAAPQAPAAPAAAPAAAPPPAQVGGRTLTSTQRNALIAELRGETGAVREVWFAYAPNNSESLAFQRDIQSAFEEAGWTVRHSAPASFSLRPGIFFLMADESPPSYVLTALRGFGAAGLEVSAGRDYRSFYATKKAEDPNWRGFEMQPDQAYIIAVGAQPRS